MKDFFDKIGGFENLIFIAIAVISSIIGVLAKKKEKPENKTPPVHIPYGEANMEEELELEPVKKIVKERLIEESKTQKTFLNKNPYRESVEHRHRKKKKNVLVKNNKENNQKEQEAIDWTKAVIYSEILNRPSF